MPQTDTQTVAFSQIKQLLEAQNWGDAFYGAETFVRQQFQKQGYGTLLLREMANEPLCQKTVFRTINPNQIKARQNAWGTPVKELFYDPLATERMWYGVQKK